MNQADIPSVNNAVDGIVYSKQEQVPGNKPSRKECEIACVDLVARFDNWLNKATELEKDDFIDQSGNLGLSLTQTLNSFRNDFLTGAAAAQVKEEVDRAEMTSLAYTEVLKTRPLTNAILRTFWKVDENPAILDSHAKLGAALIRAAGVTCFHAVVLIGLDSEFGQEIDQSTIDFVTELKRFWA